MDSLDRIKFSAVLKHEGTPWSVVVEDHGKVAYAYLVKGDDIVSDVWLYNNGEAPSPSEWKSPDNMPFANSRLHVKKIEFAPIQSAEELSVTWQETEDKKCGAELFIRGTLHAVLLEGETPGWCILAERDGPCAYAL